MVAALLCDKAKKSTKTKNTKAQKNSCISCTPNFTISFLLLKIPPEFFFTFFFFSFPSFITTFHFHLVSLVIQRIRKGLVGVFVWLEFSSLFFPYLFFSFFFDLYLISCPSSFLYHYHIWFRFSARKIRYDAFPFLPLPCNQTCCIWPLIYYSAYCYCQSNVDIDCTSILYSICIPGNLL